MGSISSIWPRYLDQSMAIAVLQHCPARLVPPPREKSGTSYFLHAATVFDFIINRFRYDNTDWDLAIVRGINRVKRLGSCIEAVSSGVMARRHSYSFPFRP